MSHARILIGDARLRLCELPDQSVQTCITSPPYFGLRDYGHGDQMGIEDTPDAYVAEMVALFREVRRVLKDDGTLWLNIGDSYSGSGKGGQSAEKRSEGWQPEYANKGATYGLKPKDLIGIPWRVAFALQADGWYLRQDIIWAKPNPMPESVTDRCTKSHEYLFLLSKSARYYYDNESIAEPSIYGARGSDFDTGKTADHQGQRMQKRHDPGQIRTPWAAPGQSEQMRVRPLDKRAGEGRLTHDGKRQGEPGQGQEAFVHIEETRNKRDVWTISTKPFKGAHFAVMPEALVEPCVLAGSAECDLVLDPFTGSGTVGVVALRHQRDFIGVELNPLYAEMAEKRITDDGPMLNIVEVSGRSRDWSKGEG